MSDDDTLKGKDAEYHSLMQYSERPELAELIEATQQSAVCGTGPLEDALDPRRPSATLQSNVVQAVHAAERGGARQPHAVLQPESARSSRQQTR